MTSQDNSQILRLPVDPEPTSLRFIVLASFLVGFAGGNLLGDVLFRWGTCTLLSFGLGIAVGLVVMFITEKLLKPFWKSNRWVRVTNDEIAFLQGETVKRSVNPMQQVNVTQWRFTIKRRSRAEKGWYVVAIALEQDDIYLPVYTIMSPERFEALSKSGQFSELTIRREDVLKNKVDGNDLRLAGLQRQLYIGETARGIDGVEMLPDDFETYLSWLQDNFYRWMP
ncbi:MAG: hypothetical protein SFZ02_14400 [bacterium]|nr:hypothetical protein [bacterium]